jgi:hypothetical protein
VSASWLSLEHVGESLPQPLKPPARRVRDLVHGHWPDRVADWRLARTSTDPQTFSEKVRFRIAYDRRPILTTLVDKVAVRDYVRDRLGDDVLVPVHGIFESGHEIPWSSLPREYAVKASHGSGAVILVWDGAPADARLPASPRYADWDRFAVRPEHADRRRMTALADKWMSLNYHYGPGRLPEWAYRDVPPRIIIEQLIRGTGGALPTDYKCLVFDGECRLFYVVAGRFDDLRIQVFNRDGSPSSVRALQPPPDTVPELAPNWRELVAAAEELGRGLDFARVDLYPVDGGIAFGEMTVYHNAGGNGWDPPSYDREIGTWWQLPAEVLAAARP